MSTASRVIAVSLATMALAGTALAQDPNTTGDPAESTGEPAEGQLPGADAQPDGGGPTVSEMTGVQSLRWVRDVVNRVLTLPKGVGQAGLEITNSTSNFFDPATIRILVGYGITDDFEINFGGYTAPHDDFGKGSLDINLGYKLARGAAGGKLEVIARAQIGYLLAEGADGDAYGITPLGLGVHAQYNISPKLALISGAPGGALLPLGLGSAAPQLQIGLQDPTATILNIPFGVGYQATPELYLQLDTNLASIVISDADTGIESGFIFADSTPLGVTATYNAMPALDVYAGLGLNVTPPEGTDLGDTVSILVGARYYFGDLGAGGGGTASPAPAVGSL